MLCISKRGQKHSADVLLEETDSHNKIMQVYSHKLTLGRAKECQMILRFVTNSRPAKKWTSLPEVRDQQQTGCPDSLATNIAK